MQLYILSRFIHTHSGDITQMEVQGAFEAFWLVHLRSTLDL